MLSDRWAVVRQILTCSSFRTFANVPGQVSRLLHRRIHNVEDATVAVTLASLALDLHKLVSAADAARVSRSRPPKSTTRTSIARPRHAARSRPPKRVPHHPQMKYSQPSRKASCTASPILAPHSSTSSIYPPPHAQLPSSPVVEVPATQKNTSQALSQSLEKVESSSGSTVPGKEESIVHNSTLEGSPPNGDETDDKAPIVPAPQAYALATSEEYFGLSQILLSHVNMHALAFDINNRRFSYCTRNGVWYAETGGTRELLQEEVAIQIRRDGSGCIRAVELEIGGEFTRLEKRTVGPFKGFWESHDFFPIPNTSPSRSGKVLATVNQTLTCLSMTALQSSAAVSLPDDPVIDADESADATPSSVACTSNNVFVTEKEILFYTALTPPCHQDGFQAEQIPAGKKRTAAKIRYVAGLQFQTQHRPRMPNYVDICGSTRFQLFEKWLRYWSHAPGFYADYYELTPTTDDSSKSWSASFQNLVDSGRVGCASTDHLQIPMARVVACPAGTQLHDVFTRPCTSDMPMASAHDRLIVILMSHFQSLGNESQLI